jgi:quinol monooxygenase YgiN
MRPFFKLIFELAIFAALLTAPAFAESDAVHLATYIEVLPAEAPLPHPRVAQTQTPGAVQALERYRDASRKEAGNLRFDVLTESGRTKRFLILEDWRDSASFDAHGKADSTAKFRQTMDAMASAPLDIRNNSALFSEWSPETRAVYVVTHIDVTGDHKDDAVALLRSMHEDTVKERGNLRYDVFQQKNRPNHFTVVEAWNDWETQSKHEAASHTRAFRQKLLPMEGALYDQRIYTALP